MLAKHSTVHVHVTIIYSMHMYMHMYMYMYIVGEFSIERTFVKKMFHVKIQVSAKVGLGLTLSLRN